MSTAAAPGPSATAPAADARLSCLYCGGTTLDPLYTGVRDRLLHVPGEHAFRACRDCGSAVLDPLPRAEELAAFYPPVYSFTPEMAGRSRLKRLLVAAEYRFYFRPQYTAQVRRILRYAGAAPAGRPRLLDVGCGRGLRLLEFRRRGFDVQGMDLQPEVVRYLADELNIPAVCADVSALGTAFPEGSFDVVTAFFVMEHVPDVLAVLADCYRLLRPGGVLAAAVPLRDSVQARAFGRRWINVTEAPRHLSLPTRDGMTRACRRAGFTDIAILPDSTLNCAGQIAASAVPGSAITRVYGQGKLLPLLTRFVGGAVMAAAIPFSWFENHVLGRPPLGIACARKPG